MRLAALRKGGKACIANAPVLRPQVPQRNGVRNRAALTMDTARRMKVQVASLLRAAIGFLIIAALGFVLYRDRQNFIAALVMSVGDLVLISAFTLLGWLVNTLMFVRMLRPLHVQLPFTQMLAINTVAGLLNYLPLRAGTLYRARSFKVLTGLPYSQFASVLAINFLLMTASAGLVGAASMAIYLHSHPSGSVALLVAFVLMIAAPILAVLVRLPGMPAKGRWGGVWNNLVYAREQIIGELGLCAVVLACYIVMFACAAMRFIGGYHAAGAPISLDAALILGSTNVLAAIISFTPGGLGIQEFVAAGVGTTVGIPAATGIIAVAAVRAVIVCWYVILGIPMMVWLRRIEVSVHAESVHPMN